MPRRSGSTEAPRGLVRYGQPAGRRVLLAATLGSALAFVDATAVNLALPRIGEDLGAGAAGLQWVVNGYTLTLASLVLLGGSLGDLLGRRRVFVVGVSWFAVASILCGLAPSVEALVAARLAQGVGGALLTPAALAVLETSFHPADRARAIGAWSGLGGIAGAVGPFLGGWIVQAGSWRLVFLINVPLAALAVAVALRSVPESRDAAAPRRPDVAGATAAAVGLAGLTYGFTAWPALGATSPTVAGALATGVAGLAAFVLVERSVRHPMLPLGIFRSRAFTAANLVTFAVYAALGGVFFLLGLNLQVVSGFTPLAAGAALLPVTGLMLLLSARAGALAESIGPRVPMTVGPLACAGALLLLARVGPHASYPVTVLPGVLVLGLGLSLTVSPLTATALGSVEERHAGLASGVNNAVARAAGLLAVAVLPLVAGLQGGALTDPATLAPTYRTAMLVCAGLLLAGAVIAAVGVPGRAAAAPRHPPPGEPAQSRAASPVRIHCAVAGPPLQPRPRRSAGPRRGDEDRNLRRHAVGRFGVGPRPRRTLAVRPGPRRPGRLVLPHEREGEVGDLPPPAVDGEGVSATAHLAELGDPRVPALPPERGERHRPRHRVVLLARDDEQRPAIRVRRVDARRRPGVEVRGGGLEQRRARGGDRVGLVEGPRLLLGQRRSPTRSGTAGRSARPRARSSRGSRAPGMPTGARTAAAGAPRGTARGRLRRSRSRAPCPRAAAR